MLFRCPHCGDRDHTEFSYLREFDPDAADDTQFRHVYLRRNEKGAHREVWQHVYGCRTVFVLERDTVTHAVHG
jgi:sarcosine oxidase subunit delta